MPVIVTLTLDDAALRGGFAALLRRADDLAPVLDAVGAALAASARRRFEQGEGPDGRVWTPGARARAGGRTLVDSGRLRDSIVHRAGPDRVEVGTDLPYAGIHQRGGTVRPRTGKALRFFVPGVGWRSAARVTVPARPFLGISAADRDAVAALLAEALVSGALGGAGPDAVP